MKKLLALLIIFATVSSVSVSSATAYEAGDPCLLYGYNPDELDNYDTHGDEVFFKMNDAINSVTGELIVVLNRRTTENIVKASLAEGTVGGIINETYFPELETDYVICTMADPTEFVADKDYYINDVVPDYECCLKCVVVLKNRTKEEVQKAMRLLSPRADIDIKGVYVNSYSLSDVSFALRHIAGWDEYSTEYLYDSSAEGFGKLMSLNTDGSEKIDLVDVSYMLKVIAGWRDEDFDPKYKTFPQESPVAPPSEELVRQIEDDYFAYSHEEGKYDPAIDTKAPVKYYYGVYNDCVPVMFAEPETGMGRSVAVADSYFTYPGSNSIQVWKNGQFFSMEDAYGRGLLTKEHVAQIADLHADGKYAVLYTHRTRSTTGRPRLYISQ